MSSIEEVYYKLKSGDGEVLQISKKALQRSGMLVTFLEINPISDEESKTMEPIDLPNVAGKVMKQVIQWCEDHKDCPVIRDDGISAGEKSDKKSEEIKQKEKALFEDLIHEELLNLLQAADYMDIKCLRLSILQIIIGLVSGKSYKEIRNFWMVESDFTAEEESEITTENAWDLLVREMDKNEKLEEAAGDVAQINIAGDN